jgi:hypothetical protein
MSYIEDYLYYNRNHGSPKLYHLWCGIYTISCALGRRVWEGQASFTPIFSNIYIILVGPQGALHKTTCITTAQQLVQRAGVTLVMADAGSKIGWLQGLQSRTMPNHNTIDLEKYMESSSYRDTVIRGAEGAFFSDDLCDLLGGKHADDERVMYLQAWWDSRAEWKPWVYRTVVRGEDVLYKPNVCLISATTDNYMHQTFPEGCTTQGFGSRVLWVIQEAKDAVIGKPFWDEMETEALIKKLRWIQTNVHGEAVFDMHAERYFDDFEKTHEERLLLESSNPTIGFLNRKGTYLKKLAMIRAAAETTTPGPLKIKAEHLEWGLECFTALEPQLNKVFATQMTDYPTRCAFHIRNELKSRPLEYMNKLNQVCVVRGMVATEAQEKFIPIYGAKYYNMAIRILQDQEWVFKSIEKYKIPGYKRPRRILFIPQEEED